LIRLRGHATSIMVRRAGLPTTLSGGVKVGSGVGGVGGGARVCIAPESPA
jgi:hypothetical protein